MENRKEESRKEEDRRPFNPERSGESKINGFECDIRSFDPDILVGEGKRNG